MTTSQSILAKVLAIYFVGFCFDGVSSSSPALTARSLSSLLLSKDPFEKQCTWLFRANPSDCQSYFQCLHGQSVMRRCPRKLHWNADGHYCEYQSKSTCQVAKKKKGTYLDESSFEVYDSTRNHLRAKWREPCPANLHKPYPEDCGKFIQCGSNDQVLIMNCPTGLHWDEALVTCNWPEYANCNISSGSGTGISALETTTTTQAPYLPPFPMDTTPSPPPPEEIVPTTLQPVTTTTVDTTAPTTTTATTTTTKRPTSSGTIYPILIPTSDYKIVCYFSSGAVHRPDGGKFTPADVDPSKCTHIIYAYACLNPLTYKLEMCDPSTDGKDGKNFYGQITSFRKLGIKAMIAVGGWDDSAFLKWTSILKDVAKMETFIKSVSEFLTQYEFDGFEVHYLFPVCPQTNCNFDAKNEKQAFVELIKGLRLVSGPQTILSAAVSCNENIVKEAYDVPALSKYLDFINLIAYDLHGAWEPKTGMNAPSTNEFPDEPFLNVEHAVNVFIRLGAPAGKLILGMPMYGQTFTLADRMAGSQVGAKSSGPGRPGPITKQAGRLAYYEICSRNWTRTVADMNSRVGTYSYDMDEGTWVSYDDPDFLRSKCNYVKKMGLGGAMIWTLDLDDFSNTCKKGAYPLLSVVNSSLRGSPKTYVLYRGTTKSIPTNKRTSSSVQAAGKNYYNIIRHRRNKASRIINST